MTRCWSCEQLPFQSLGQARSRCGLLDATICKAASCAGNQQLLCCMPRRDMAALEGQAGTLDLAEPCARCGRALGTVPRADAEHTGGAVPQFYLFPTGNAFHGACLAAEALASAPPQQRAKLQGILKRLAQVNLGALGCCRRTPLPGS